MSDVIPEGWGVLPLKDICNAKYGIVDGPFGSNLKTEHYRESGIPVFQSGFVTSNRFVKKKYVFVDENKYQEQIRSSAAPRDILMAKIGMNAGACAIIPDNHEVGILAGNSLKMTVNQNIASNNYIANHLHFMQETGGIRRLLTETAQPAISITTLKKHIVLLPPLPEQQKIAAILSSVDEVIEKTQAQINKLKDLKTGMMQELLSPREGQAAQINNPQGESKNSLHHTEFKDSPLGRIPVGWEVAELVEYLSYISYGFTNPMPNSDEGPLMITAKDVNHLKVQYESARKTTQQAYDELLTMKSRPKRNDILLTKDGTLGRVALVDRDNICINQSVAVLRPNENILPKFLLYLLAAPSYQREMLDKAGGSAIKHIYITVVDKMKIAVPNIKEQQKIIKVIDAIFEKLSLSETKLSDYLNIKKALMQDLLTGKVRVKVDAI